MNHQDVKNPVKPQRRTIMPAYYKMSQDLGPLPKRFVAKRARILMVTILAAGALALVLYIW